MKKDLYFKDARQKKKWGVAFIRLDYNLWSSMQFNNGCLNSLVAEFGSYSVHTVEYLSCPREIEKA